VICSSSSSSNNIIIFLTPATKTNEAAVQTSFMTSQTKTTYGWCAKECTRKAAEHSVLRKKSYLIISVFLESTTTAHLNDVAGDTQSALAELC
jgi:hypothetical protein